MAILLSARQRMSLRGLKFAAEQKIAKDGFKRT
jgi:hypothetical protein